MYMFRSLVHEWRMRKYCLSLPRVKNVEAHLPQTETFTEERRHAKYFFLSPFSADRKWQKTRLHSVTCTLWPREVLFLAQTCFQSLQIGTGLKGTVARDGFKDYIYFSFSRLDRLSSNHSDNFLFWWGTKRKNCKKLCVGGCWDRTQECCDFTLSNHSARSHPHSARSHPTMKITCLRGAYWKGEGGVRMTCGMWIEVPTCSCADLFPIEGIFFISVLLFCLIQNIAQNLVLYLLSIRRPTQRIAH
jgi:hypothetical protein